MCGYAAGSPTFSKNTGGVSEQGCEENKWLQKEAVGSWRKLRNDELCSLCPSPEYYYDQVIESEIGWHALCMEELRNSNKILIRKPRVKFHFECLGICRRIILKWILKEIGSEDADRIYQA